MTGPVDWDSVVLEPCMDIFGESVTWTAKDGMARQITGIFDAGWKAADPLGHEEGLVPTHVTSSLPVLGVRLGALPFPPEQGDRLVIRGKIYTVQEVQADSHGGLHLALNEGQPPSETPSRRNGGPSPWVSP